MFIVRPRVMCASGLSLGPGKLDLLRKVAELHSISAAARSMNMSYKRAWNLVDSLNKGLDAPVVQATSGGAGGGGAEVTALGIELLRRYAALEKRVQSASRVELEQLRKLLEG